MGRNSALTLEEFAEHKGLPADYLRKSGVIQFADGIGIAYLDETGKEYAVKRRTKLKAGEGSYWPKGVPLCAFGRWRIHEAAKTGILFIVEGESDTLTLWFYRLPALGLPGSSTSKTLLAGHIVGIRTIYVSHEPDKGGDTFVAQVTSRLRQLGYEGTVYQLDMPAGIKDVSELHLDDPEKFRNRLDECIRLSKPLSQKTVADHAFDSNGKLHNEHLSDVGNAQRLVRCHGQNLRYCHPWGKWFYWDQRRWRVDDTGGVERLAKDTVKQMYLEAANHGDEKRIALSKHALATEHAHRIKAMVEMARSEPGIPLLPADMDRDPWLLNCLNGILDLRTGKLREHRRDAVITKLCPVEFNATATAEIWERFINHIFNGAREVIMFVRRLMGYCLTGDVREQVLPIFWGAGANGKSTLLNAMLEMLGEDYAITAARDLLLTKRGETHPTERADLFGKRLVVAVETDEGRRLAESLVKDLTGGDVVCARRMREDFWRFRPMHKLILCTNHKPVITGTDTAIWRRLRLIPFNVTIPLAQQDKTLPDKLRAELSGILAWCVRGCLEWQRDGLGIPDAVRTATSDYKDEQDTLGVFISENCAIGSTDYRVKATDLRSAFNAWSKRCGESEISQRRFGELMTEKSFQRQMSNGVWYIGIKTLLDGTLEPWNQNSP